MIQSNGILGENKKIKGAKGVIFEGIKFKSRLEMTCYKKFKEAGLNFSYEPEKVILWEGFKPSSIVVYIPNKINGKLTKDLCIQNRSLINITYTPDFIVIKDDYKIYFDAKGKENDTYPIKRKMFLKYLENKKDGYKYMFFEPHSAKQMLDAIDIIKAL
jgi:hypothetical protein